MIGRTGSTRNGRIRRKRISGGAVINPAEQRNHRWGRARRSPRIGPTDKQDATNGGQRDGDIKPEKRR